MHQKLDIERFISLKKKELKSDDEKNSSLQNLKVSTQSIYHWIQYCEYHYINLIDSATPSNLRLDRISDYRRATETVPIRFVYEANIVAFLNSLHALLDAFPFLLNIFIPVTEKTDSTSIKWQESFIKRYDGMPFYDELINLFIDTTFHKVKGYVNTIKHKHLIRISNQIDQLKFEEYNYKQPYRDEQGKIEFKRQVATGENIVSFIENCHDELIPKLFRLCDSVMDFKSSQLTTNT